MITFSEKKMNRVIWIVLVTTLCISCSTSIRTNQAEVLKVREAVWRAWFANDTKTLQELVPADTIVISGGEKKWKNQEQVFQSAADFQSGGGKLIRLEFPRTEIQQFGNVAIIWSSYL